VLTEAAASGCLLIAASTVGAADELVDETVNGFTYIQNSSVELAGAFLKITQFSLKQSEIGRAESIRRAKRFAPKVWSETLLKIYAVYINSKRE
jgi:glycosyltransferase involved in cell wall biosynthesis